LTQVTLVFGAEAEHMTSTDFIMDVLYREGFFEGGKILGEVMEAIEKRRYMFGKSSVANNLRNFSKGKDAILTRRKAGRQFKYFERIPPERYFKSTI
jgi:hypothetical protein